LALRQLQSRANIFQAMADFIFHVFAQPLVLTLVNILNQLANKINSL
jgi:hypothetical protein